eukprot:jgi/Botrbrau1/20701/Bobra.0058s0030.1
MVQESEGGAAVTVADARREMEELSLSKSDRSQTESERAHGSCAALTLLPRQAESKAGDSDVSDQMTPPRTPPASTPAGAGPAGRAEPASGAPPGPAPEGLGETATAPAPFNRRSAPAMSHGATAPPAGSHMRVSFADGLGHEERPAGRSIVRVRSLMDPHAPGLSIHGEEAFRRQGFSELLFFATVGDVLRCKKVAEKYKLDVTSSECCGLDGRTPMHVAAINGCYSVVLWLLDSGANPNATDEKGVTPLEEAIAMRQDEVRVLLESRNARLGPLAGTHKGSSDALADSEHAQGCARCRALRLSTIPLNEWEINRAEITLGRKVGQGRFGRVFKATWLGTTVAVKQLRYISDAALRDYKAELNVLQKIHHPNAVQFLGAVTKEQPSMFVTEFLPGGSLADLLKLVEEGNLPPLSIRRAAELALDCCHGMVYLHSRRPYPIIHRDSSQPI